MNIMRLHRAACPAAALLLLTACMTGCGQPDDSGTQSPDSAAGAAGNTSSQAEPQKPADKTESAEDSGSVSEESSAGTEASQAEEPEHYELPALVHATEAEVIGLMGGDYELFPDEMPGAFYFCNEKVFPRTRFYVWDSSFEHVTGSGRNLEEYEPEIRSALKNSGIEIDKINTYAGGMEIDGIVPGKPFREYADIIDSDSYSFGNYGEYLSGAPASSACKYDLPDYQAQITLHFTLTGDYEEKENDVMESGSFPASVMERDNPELELITVTRADGYPKAVFTEASASSVLEPQETDAGMCTYDASNVLDGDLSTCWAEGAGGLGCGESITLKAAEPQTVSSITIFGGLQTDEKHFLENAHPTELLAEFDDGSVYRVWIPEKFTDSGISYFLCSGKKTASVKITLRDVKPGTQNENTCISEIRFE